MAVSLSVFSSACPCCFVTIRQWLGFCDGQFGLPTRPALFFLWAGIRLYLQICFASIFPLWMFFYLFFPAQHFLVNWKKKKKREENGVSCGWPVMKEERVLFSEADLVLCLSSLSLSLSLCLGLWVFYLFFSSCDGTRAVSKRSSESYNLAGGKSTRPNAVYLYTLTVAKPARQRFLYLLNKKY